MNIAIWIYRLGGGGAERVITKLASSFAAQNHSVTIYVHGSDNPYAKELHDNVRVEILHNPLPDFVKPRTLGCVFDLGKRLKNGNHDVILTTGMAHSVLLVLIKFLRRLKIPIVIRETNTLTAKAKKSGKILFPIALPLIKFFYPKADAVVAPSHGVKDDLERQILGLKNKIHVIANPVDFKEITRLKQEPLPKHEFDLPKPFIMSAGRLVPQKGFEILITAWAAIAAEKNVNLLILGQGPERKKLESLAENLGVADRLFMPGFDLNPFRYMSRAKLYILSSYFEGLPNALLQAMACECPVISTDCLSGPHEILEGGKIAPLVPVGDAQELQSAIAQALDIPPDTDLALNKIRTAYDPQAIAGEYLDVFLSIT